MGEVIDKIKLHLEVQKRCHRVPLYNTVEELRNPTGIYAEEYSRIMKQLKEDKQYENRNYSK